MEESTTVRATSPSSAVLPTRRAASPAPSRPAIYPTPPPAASEAAPTDAKPLAEDYALSLSTASLRLAARLREATAPSDPIAPTPSTAPEPTTASLPLDPMQAEDAATHERLPTGRVAAAYRAVERGALGQNVRVVA